MTDKSTEAEQGQGVPETFTRAQMLAEVDRRLERMLFARNAISSTLEGVVNGDHARGCQGREYTCTCGHDIRVADALAHITDERNKANARAESQWAGWIKADCARRAAEAERDRLREALAGLPKIISEIHAKWDEGMRAGKLLIALMDPKLNYRADVTKIHAALAEGGTANADR